VEELATTGGGEITTSSMPTRLIKPTIPLLKRTTPPVTTTNISLKTNIKTTRGLGLPAQNPLDK
jgi:hypothetical protein